MLEAGECDGHPVETEIGILDRTDYPSDDTRAGRPHRHGGQSRIVTVRSIGLRNGRTSPQRGTGCQSLSSLTTFRRLQSVIGTPRGRLEQTTGASARENLLTKKCCYRGATNETVQQRIAPKTYMRGVNRTFWTGFLMKRRF
jgi:hypothetical protein